jgi:hypothetical protein
MSKSSVEENTLIAHAQKVSSEQDRRATELSARLKNHKTEIRRILQIPVYQANTLIVQSISAEIEKPENNTIKYGELLKKLQLIHSSENLWENDYQTTSLEFLNRLGGLKPVTKNLKSYFKKYLGLKKDAENKPVALTCYNYNKMINQLLLAAVVKYPDWNFGKILRELELVKDDPESKLWLDESKTSSEQLYKRIVKYKELLSANSKI